jgi:sugar phosphate permease
MLALAIPGLAVALLTFLAVREPARGALEGGDDVHDPDSRTAWSSFKYLVRIPTVGPLLAGYVLFNLASAGYLGWVPTYLLRVHHMTMSTMSFWYGLASLGGMCSIALLGHLSDRMVARGARWRMYFCAGLLVLGAPVCGGVILAPGLDFVIPMMFAFTFVVGPVNSLSLTAGLDVVRPRMRGLMTGMIGFCTSLVGGGVGPVLLGWINDLAKLAYGGQSLRYTLVAVPILFGLGCFAFLWASRTADKDAEAASRGPMGPLSSLMQRSSAG